MDKTELRILLVEDNPADVLFLREALAWDDEAYFDLTVAESLGAAWELLPAQTFAAVLLDLGLPDSQGLDTFLKFHRSAPELPVVVLSALDDEDIATQAMQSGAQDYLVKRPRDFPSAGRALRYAIERNKLQSTLRESEGRFTLLFRSNPVAAGITRASDYRIVDVNEAWTKLTGYTREEAIGHTSTELGLAKPETLQKVRGILDAQATIRENEILLYTRAGQERRMLISTETIELGGETCFLTNLQDITERKQAEEKLQTLTNLLSDGQRIAHMGSFEYDARTKSTVWSEEECRIYGYDPAQPSPDYEAMLAHSIHPADADLLNRTFLAAMQNGAVYELEHRIVQPDGSVRWVYDRAHPYFDGHGQLLRYVGVTQDITERKAAEQKIRESEENYKTLFESNPHPMWVYDLETLAFLTVNEAAIYRYGYSREEFLRMTILDIRPPEDHQRLRDNVAAVTQGLDEAGAWRHLKKDGSIMDVEITSHTLDYYGRKAEIILANDITARKQAEEKLRESEEKYRTLSQELEQRIKDRTAEVYAIHERLELATQAAELGVWDWNVQTNQLHWDDQMFRIHRMEKSAFTGNLEFFMNALHPEDAGGVAQKVQELLGGAPPQGPIEYRVIRGDGSVGYLKTHGLLQRDDQGQIARFIGVVQDVTLEKHAENALRENHDRLSIANIALEKALRVKDEFLASMSHELRTPLTGILGFSEALELNIYGELNQRQLKIVKGIHDSGRHLLDLINDILDLSKIEAGKLEIQKTPVLLADLCRASLQLAKGMAHQKRQVVNAVIPDEPIIINLDARRIKQVLVNLLSNAIKFTPEESELGLIVEPDETLGQVRLIVWDKGIGIKPENLSKLFQPFTQIDSSLAREYSGTGLGLALVKRLVELHDGTVAVESAFGAGSRFIVTLPWLMTAAQRGAPETQPALMPPVTLEDGLSRLIFITDDNPILLEMLADFLGAQNYRTATALNGLDLLARVADLKPDLLLMDIQMPGMDGLEVIRRLRQHPDPAIAATPVIAVTALAMTGDRERCLAAGANDYVSKPINLGELTRIIHNLIVKDGK